MGRVVTSAERLAEMLPIKRKSSVLLVPLIAFELVFFAIPFLILLRISLSEQSSESTHVAGTWSLEAYAQIWQSGVLRHVVIFSFLFGLVTTALTVFISFVYSYAIWRSDGLKKAILLFSVVLPLLTTLVIKAYAWVPLLTPTGTVNDVLLALGILSVPQQFVPGLPGAIVGQLYVIIPYAVLAIYSVMSTMDWGRVEAARDLGASRPRSVLEVVVPQAMPGVAVATVISFAWNIGAYAAPALLGGGSERTFAVEVESQMLLNLNWPLASALAIFMMVFILVCIMAILSGLNRIGGGVDDVQ